MTVKEKVEELQKCADRHRRIHDSRQKVEYRVLITVLTFYAGATWAILEQAEAVVPFRLAISIGYFTLAALTVALLKRLHSSNQVNIAIAENYEAEIIRLLELENNPVPERLQRTDYNRVRTVNFPVSNWGLQAVLAFGFAIIGAVLIWAK